jgi:hypothetical protein
LLSTILCIFLLFIIAELKVRRRTIVSCVKGVSEDAVILFSDRISYYPCIMHVTNSVAPGPEDSSPY